MWMFRTRTNEMKSVRIISIIIACKVIPKKTHDLILVNGWFKYKTDKKFYILGNQLLKLEIALFASRLETCCSLPLANYWVEICCICKNTCQQKCPCKVAGLCCASNCFCGTRSKPYKNKYKFYLVLFISVYERL